MVRFAVYTAVLYAGLVHNVFCVQEHVLLCTGEFRPGHLTGDCTFVVNRMRQPDEGPWGGLAHWSATGWQPYRSQFGLQGVAFAAIQKATGAPPERVAAVGGALFGLATSALIAAFFASLVRRIGPLAGDVGVLLSASAPPLLAFAPSLYWALPAMLAPFVFVWLIHPWAAKSGWRWAALLAGVGGLVCAKALCGYEYISTVVAAPVAAVVYHRAAAGDGLRRWVRPCAAVGLAGVVGFAAAMGLHAAQISAQTGESGLTVIRERAAARTAVPDGSGNERVVYALHAPAFLPEPVRCFVNYFYQPAVSSPQTWGRGRFTVSMGWVLAAAGVCVRWLWRARDRDPAAAALGPALLVGLLGAVSWQGLAVNHMVYHGHLNLIVFFVPCGLLAFAAIGAGVSRLVRPGRATLGLAALAVVGVNAVVVSNRAAERTALDAAAEERVRAVIRGEATAQPVVGQGPEPLTSWLPLDPPYLPSEYFFSPNYHPAVPPCERPLGAYGWVRLPRERSGRLRLSVVAVRGSEVVPVRVGYFRNAAVERLWGGRSACVAYQAVVPPGERPRLFGVPADPALPVVELTSR